MVSTPSMLKLYCNSEKAVLRSEKVVLRSSFFVDLGYSLNDNNPTNNESELSSVDESRSSQVYSRS